MFALTFLGTSASVPSSDRNHPGLLVEAGSHRILVDCGEGTQRQLLRSGAGFRRLDRILLTHAHFDHVLGIPGLFYSSAAAERRRDDGSRQSGHA
jgi:ribonuclease Z